MINFSLIEFGSTCSQLMNELLQVTLHIHDTGHPNEPADEAKTTSLAKWLGLWKESAGKLEAQVMQNAISRLSRKLTREPTYHDLEYGLRSIQDALKDSMQWHLVYRYPTAKANVFTTWRADWNDVLANYPDTQDDIRAGVDLWAMHYPTASVFHMMRVLETGLQKIAAELLVSFAAQNWQTVIDQIEAVIRQQQRTLPKGDARNTRLRFLSELAKELVYFKDGWRNYVSHNKGTYDDAQARLVMDHVRHFMMTLARESHRAQASNSATPQI